MRRVIAATLALMLILGGCTVDKDRKEELWNVGFACGELIPDGYDAVSDTYSEVYYVAGYKNDHHATAMLDPQLVRASYISDGIGCNIVLVSIDCIGISKTDLDRIKDDLKGFVRDNNIDAIHIASTHTHAGIDTLGLWGPIGIDGKNSAFMEKIAEVTKETIVRSCENIRQGRMYFGYADTGKIQRDSRYPEIYDKNIYRIRFAPEDGSKGLEIISYDAHAESLRSENTKVSADYPCYMGRKIKDETGNEFMFFAGAVGGLIMTHVLKDERGLEYPYETNVIKTGEYLADCVLSIDNERELYPDLSTDTEVFDVPLDNQLFATMSFLGVLSAKAVRGEGRYSLALRTEASLLNLGGEEGINIALVPGELFPELAMGGDAAGAAASPERENPPSLKSLLGENTIIYGLANDEIGYIVTPNDFYLSEKAPYLENAYDRIGRRHYEETNSVGSETAWELYKAFERIKNRD